MEAREVLVFRCEKCKKLYGFREDANRCCVHGTRIILFDKVRVDDGGLRARWDLFWTSRSNAKDRAVNDRG